MFTLFPHFNHLRINFGISNEILDTFSLETFLKKIQFSKSNMFHIKNFNPVLQGINPRIAGFLLNEL